MTIRRWEPFGELMSLRQAMDRMFEDAVVRPNGLVMAGGGGTVAFDVYETTDHLVVKALLPGWKPDDVDVTITGDTLTIKGQTKAEQQEEEEKATWHVREIRQASFARTMTLPMALKTDQAEAMFEDGVLTLRIPKADDIKPRQIKVNARQAIESTGKAK
jgi:HSP20 family protein